MNSAAPTIFVVDDDDALLLSLARSLKLRGYMVETFPSAESFLEGHDPSRPGCLILDYGLPGMNGLELQAHLNSEGVKTPIIFITGHGGVPESVRATKAGAVDFLEKPYKPDALVQQIENALEVDRALRDRKTSTFKFDAALASLTVREREIFDLMLARPDLVSNKAIALELDISPRTAEKHRAQVLLKTDCRSVAELISRYTMISTGVSEE
jgi:FixJ family two-component response regulator